MKRFLCGLTALCCAVLGKEADIDNVIGDSGDDAVLKAMKSSGVVNAMEEELSGGLTTQDKDMLVSFVEEYNADNNKDVTPKNVVDIVGKIAKNKKPNMPQIFVQLSPVLDLLHTLETGSKRIDIIIGQYAEVLEDPKKSSKETLHLFKKVLDNEVLKQRIHSHPGDSMKKQKKPEKGQGVLDSLLKEFFKNKNPAELLSLMNGDLSALSNILGSTDLLGILKTVIDSFFSSSPYGPIIQQYAGKFLESDQGRELLEGAKEMMAGLAESTSGQRLLRLAPQLMGVRDMQSLMEILGKEVEYNWRLFFTKLVNSNYKDEFVIKISEASVRVYEYFKNPPKSSPVNQLPLILNGFLISYNLPAFDSKAPAKSVAAVLNKALKLFSTLKFDVAPYVENSYATVTEALGKHMTESQYRALDLESKVNLVANILESELVEPVLKVWHVYTQAAELPKCAAKFLCEINSKEKKSEAKKVGVVKAASYAASWTMSKASTEIYWKLYHAVNAGSAGADCDKSYPSTNCVLRERLLDHSEL